MKEKIFIAVPLIIVGLFYIKLSTSKPQKNTQQKTVSIATLHENKDSLTIDSNYIKAIEHLKLYEGLRNKIYIGVNGIPTIGYGHQLLKNEFYNNINDSVASEILEKDVQTRLDYISKKYNLLGDTLLALTLFSFNCGTGTLDKAISKGLLKDPKMLLNYCNYKTYDTLGNVKVHSSKNLLKRRQFELALITNKNI